MHWRNVQWVALDSLSETASWRARLIARFCRAAQAAETKESKDRKEVRSPVWDDPWIDLGGEG
jgi:hypothetical protein